MQFTISGVLPYLYQCHCSLCRRQTGAASNAATIVPTEHFAWLAGLQLVKKWQQPEGMSSHFCSECGSPVPNPLSADHALMWIPAGLLASAQTRVVAHLCCDSKAEWDNSILAGTRVFDGLPQDLRAFVDSLQNTTH
ncbi:MAG: GFA family protein [Granulosicoccaceae bacterium]